MDKCDIVVFFFKQKTAYELCGRDWSSDVCSSDLERKKRKRVKSEREIRNEVMGREKPGMK